MPAFKPKAAKKIKVNKKSAITLDGKHKEFVTQFAKDESDRIPELKSEKSKLKKQLEDTKSSLSIEEKLELKDKIEDISKQIKTILSKKKEYYLDNSKYIFEYFENKKNISSKESAPVNKSKLLDSFFKIKVEFGK